MAAATAFPHLISLQHIARNISFSSLRFKEFGLLDLLLDLLEIT